MEERRLSVSVFPFTSWVNPIKSRIKIVINILGTVVYVMYRMCSNNFAPETAGAKFVVSLKGESLSPK